MSLYAACSLPVDWRAADSVLQLKRDGGAREDEYEHSSDSVPGGPYPEVADGMAEKRKLLAGGSDAVEESDEKLPSIAIPVVGDTSSGLLDSM